MNFSFDHLVLFLNKPEEAIANLNLMGIHAVKGGRHQSWGTYNTLTYFGLSYIEFLGIENSAIAMQQEENRLITQIVEQLAEAKQEGPARIAIRTNDIEKLASKFKEDGVKVYGPLPGERVRADGVIIKWSLLFPEASANELCLPFFIQWEKSDGERLEELDEQGLLDSHFIGKPVMESVGFVVKDLGLTTAKWGGMLNLNQSEEFFDETLNAQCRILDLAGTKLMFCSPRGEGIADELLRERGETPFLINLTGTNQRHLFKMMNGLWRLQ